MLIGHHWAHGLRVHWSARGDEDLGSIPVVRRHSRRWTILSTARRDVDEVTVLRDHRAQDRTLEGRPHPR
eukprot:2577560-Prymnesium_polylepis.1